ncbi:hypothetical protein [Halolamina salifodinae]|uniref:Uncharacterized protein n=1 Tax=Halolamina salifodinae TaxID=1202767 RepID=A0A8T4GVN2_9EURY|nr:hypothetical protein [Halolamina salifodinae]MBP1986966.1 hypothetical protein [Halolamina salifodinae]
MKRRTYLSTVGASVALPLGVGSSVFNELQEPDRLTPDEFRQQIPEQIGNYEGGIVHEGETNNSGKLLIAIYQDTEWPVGIQYIEQNDPQIIAMMYCTHHYPDSLSEGVTRLSRFFSKVDVEYEQLRDGYLEYITYEFSDGYRVRTEYDLRDNGKKHRAWVNGDLLTFDDQIERNELVNEEVQSRL